MEKLMMIMRTRSLPLIGLILLALILLAGCAKQPETEAASISAAALAARLGTSEVPAILDVRTPEEFAAGHVPGAINLPYDEVTQRIDEVADLQGEEVVVYCRSGKRAGLAESDLRAAGFSKVIDLEGHMQGWEAGGFPVE